MVTKLTMDAPNQKSFLSLSQHGFHNIVYYEWQPKLSPTLPSLICVHGLTRTGRDFDNLAAALSAERKVFCPDVVGRGQSDWLPAAEGYGYPQYLADMTALIARTGASEVDWVGTSMGGLIGLMLAAQQNSPIRRLVLNDIGPFIPAEALARIGTYVGKAPRFSRFAEAQKYMMSIHSGFGNLTDNQWHHLTAHAIRKNEAGEWILAYDPNIAAPFAEPSQIADIDLWHIWDAVSCPVLIIRGEQSELLTQATAEEMQRRGPHTTYLNVADAGHAPALLETWQIDQIRNWLLMTLEHDPIGQDR